MKTCGQPQVFLCSDFPFFITSLVLLHLLACIYFSHMALNLKEAINVLENGSWCSLRFITANVKKGTGGKVIDLPKGRIARNAREANATSTASQDQHSAKERPEESYKKRDANHSLNITRNVELPNKRIVTLHPPLITHINNVPVL